MDATRRSSGAGDGSNRSQIYALQEKGTQSIRFERVSLTYDNGRTVFDDFSMEVEHGQVTCLMGSSGIGKTTLLRMAAGLVKPTAGTIYRENPERMGYVFQEPRLLPAKTVLDNVRWVLNGEKDEEKNRMALELLMEADLSTALHDYPDQLSGGMKQRVAVVRAFVTTPGLLFMDEPFQSLDAATRQDMHRLFLRLWEREKPTVIVVTHDLEEALTLGTRIVVLDGKPAIIKADVSAATTDKHGRTGFSEPIKARLRQIISATDERADEERYG